MSNSKFLQFHTLTSYPGTLLNRDDAGFAKRLPFGGAERIRVSSQCLKYHWRNHEGEHALYNLDVPKSIRSRRTFLERVVAPLVEDGYPRHAAQAATYVLQQTLLAGKRPSKVSKTDLKTILAPGDDDDPEEYVETNQVTIFGVPEVREIRRVASEMLDEVRDEHEDLWAKLGELTKSEASDLAGAIRNAPDQKTLRDNLRGLELASGLDAAMFGRMATSDILARGDAAVHVAHAITTHREENESDYFTAVDELKAAAEGGELGSGHLNSAELTSGLFYSYVVIDVPLLVSNIQSCPREEWRDVDTELPARVVEQFVHLLTTVSPGAKLGSTAPYSYAQMLLAESGSAQPRTLANAFQTPVDKEDVLTKSYRALGNYVSQMDDAYGDRTERRLMSTGPEDATEGLADAIQVDQTHSVPEIAEWAADQVRG